MFGGGVTTAIAASSALIVAAGGLVAYLAFGPARSRTKGSLRPLCPAPPELGATPLALVAAAFALVLGSNLVLLGDFWAATACWGWGGPECDRSGSVQILAPLVALLLVLAGTHYLRALRRSPGREETAPETSDAPSGWQRYLLPGVLLVVLVRNYSGVVLFDWPFIRGVDHYSHAVMANRMMSEGEIFPYLVYPPGFHLAVAEVSRLGGLDPLEIYPVLGPLLPLLPALACYVLAKRLWGWRVGTAAAFLVGLVAGGPYYYLNDSMYPNLVASQFLLVLTVAALVALYVAPSWRSGLLLAALGSSVVLYHQVSSLYLGLLLAAVSASVLPYLLLRERRTGLVLFGSLALLTLVSALYAWFTYDLPGVVASALGLSEAGATGDAVSSAIGTQRPFTPGALLGTIVSQPISWLALLGGFLAAGAFLRRGREPLPGRLALLTLALWAGVILSGSLTSFSGFPQRFGRDLGVPLALFAAFGLVSLGRSLATRMPAWRLPPVRSRAFYAAAASVVLVGAVTGLRVAQGFEQAATPSWRMTTTEEISEAGEWLRKNNTGGNIMVSPQRTQVPSRMMLAMGHYSALQSFTEANIELDRDLPPTGPEPLRDVLTVMEAPTSEESLALIEKHDVRYIVLYKDMPDRAVTPYWLPFQVTPSLYERVFENDDVVIFAPRAPASGTPAP
ncbi:Hypothetical Protein RradSPS_0490 [Rubrobacter radiotolerans]|uniref:Dolichyl-phosphate-mannose-protein mannosyltransferase n=1 Tax=Rubrobacter radiotolerans TaxID=42256 RepID=A0A023X0A4_RUBRA|nr:hypothetical protein [Rubrobacter radiotolerans]AHY45773.1 Hypothetical Protein RradSPS_0490 [Rubrobacter radiotolerans]MDX5893188.1 hypothetical protein [Rubrobacter radiotolerans]SMC03234.1 conserved hypothetical protein [Rubrobacter radiotolerans DSM 5868]